MLRFRDGEVFFTDDGKKSSVYDGHVCADGDEELVMYGDKLDVDQISDLEHWKITSKTADAYKGEGLVPVEVFRKLKVWNSTHDWQYTLDHWIFSKHPEPLKNECEYILKMDPAINSDAAEASFTFDIENQVSEAIHVNMIAYTPESAIKSADLYLWLGDGGPRNYRSFEGKQAWLLNTGTFGNHEVGKVEFWKESSTEAENRNLTGSSVGTVDFSSIKKPGTYRLVIEGVGCSLDFEITNEAFFEPYRYSLRGYYYMRVGKDPVEFPIYITDFDPFDQEWIERRGDTWDEPHWRSKEDSVFWKHWVPANPTNPHAKGGHSDALDWDRHLSHVSNLYDMLLPYLLSDGMLDDDDLGIAESGNGISDLIDEARNEVDLFLSIRHEGGYSQGLTNPTVNKDAMFQVGNTTMAAWENAANCAMFADTFRVSGHEKLMEYYRDEAITAYNYAGKQENLQLDDTQGVGKRERMWGRDFKFMAAAFLYNVTGDRKWEDVIADESVAKNDHTYIEFLNHWMQGWGTAAYLLSPQKRHYPELYENMKSCVRHQAFEHNVKWMYVRSSRRSSNNNLRQTTQNLHMVVLAHAISDNLQEKEELEKSMILEADWGLGRNPSNTVEMTGLGERHIFNCFTFGRNDGTPEMHPGHTPYNSMIVWSKTRKGSNPEWFSDRGYPAWHEGCPYQEAHFNTRYSYSNAEFTQGRP